MGTPTTQATPLTSTATRYAGAITSPSASVRQCHQSRGNDSQGGGKLQPPLTTGMVHR